MWEIDIRDFLRQDSKGLECEQTMLGKNPSIIYSIVTTLYINIENSIFIYATNIDHSIPLAAISSHISLGSYRRKAVWAVKSCLDS